MASARNGPNIRNGGLTTEGFAGRRGYARGIYVKSAEDHPPPVRSARAYTAGGEKNDGLCLPRPCSDPHIATLLAYLRTWIIGLFMRQSDGLKIIVAAS